MSIVRKALKLLFASLFIVGGLLHFIATPSYIRIMPPYLPAHKELVYISGAVEAVLGVLLLVPRTQKLAAWALIPTLLAIFPANVHAALTAGSDQPAMPGVPVWAAWLRLPLQAALIGWAYYYTKRDK